MGSWDPGLCSLWLLTGCVTWGSLLPLSESQMGRISSIFSISKAYGNPIEIKVNMDFGWWVWVVLSPTTFQVLRSNVPPLSLGLFICKMGRTAMVLRVDTAQDNY